MLDSDSARVYEKRLTNTIQPCLQALDWYPSSNKASTFKDKGKAVGCILAELGMVEAKLTELKAPFGKAAAAKKLAAQANQRQAERRLAENNQAQQFQGNDRINTLLPLPWSVQPRRHDCHFRTKFIPQTTKPYRGQ
jgi:hypothetical protein